MVKPAIEMITNELPLPGDVFSFGTGPFNLFSVSPTGRFAAFKILGLNEHVIALAVQDGIWTSPPSLIEVANCAVLIERSFARSERRANFALLVDYWNKLELESLAYLGNQPICSAEHEAVINIFSEKIGTSYIWPTFISNVAEGEWRWQHDRDALIDERKRNVEHARVLQAAQELKFKKRLKSLTWQQMLSEAPFERWSQSPPHPPADFVAGAQSAIHDACRALEALGTKPKKSSGAVYSQKYS